MNPLEQFEAAFADDPFMPLHEHLASNDDQMLEDLVSMRKAKNLSQDVVADRMNRSKTAVSNFERLGDDPHLSTIRRYAAAVGATITTHVSDFEETDPQPFSEDVLKVRVKHIKVKKRQSADHTADAELEDWATV
ncbi:MAG: helix-turn-helix transcriptional regulator [Mycobacterium sp.]